MPGVPRHDPEPITTYVAKPRCCLMCGASFASAWPGERICPVCKGSHAFDNGMALSDQYL